MIRSILSILTISISACLIIISSMTATLAQSAQNSTTELRVMTIERKPFAMKQPNGFTGFSIELWNEIAKELKLKFRYVEAASFSDMLKQVQDRKADLAIANISITASREKSLDFSHPIFDAGIRVMVPAGGGTLNIFSAFLNWTMLAWLAGGALVVFVIGTLMWFFERKHQPYFDQPYRSGLWPSFWYALHVLLTGGFEENSPRSVPGRVFATILVVASLFVVSIFVARITSILTVHELRSQIQSHKDLYGRRVGTTQGSTASAFLSENSIGHRGFKTIDDMFKALVAGELDAVVHDAPILSYFAATEGRGRVRVVGPILRPEKFGIALAPGSQLVEPINRALLQISEEGRYRRLLRKWFADGS